MLRASSCPKAHPHTTKLGAGGGEGRILLGHYSSLGHGVKGRAEGEGSNFLVTAPVTREMDGWWSLTP